MRITVNSVLSVSMGIYENICQDPSYIETFQLFVATISIFPVHFKIKKILIGADTNSGVRIY